jgi:CP family cyanate transporter-like MFS transporter
MNANVSEQMNRQQSSRTERGRASSALLVGGIILLALNLRASLTSVGPLISVIQADTHISDGLAGLLTTLPLLAFAALSPLASRLARRFGMKVVLLFSLFILTLGIVVRSLSPVVALFGGTAILGMAIALMNVLLPSLVKRDFPRHAGVMTSIYTSVMSASASLAAGISIPLAAGLGWRRSLLSWAFLSVLAVFVWLPQLRSRHLPEAPAREGWRPRDLWHSALAWQITLFMGLQSLMFYVIIAWGPTILIDAGMNAATAGLMLALNQVVSVLASLVVPVIAARFPGQRPLVIGAAILCLTAVIGLGFVGSSLAALWMALLGLGSGACISLALMFFIVRAPDALISAELSGMAQSIGYLLAAVGPTMFGLVHDWTHSWTTPLLLLALLIIVMLLAGLGAGRDALVAGQEPQVAPKPH